MNQDRIEKILSAQASIRAAYRRGQIDDALAQFKTNIGPALETADPRLYRLAHRLAKSLITMVDADLASTARAALAGHQAMSIIEQLRSDVRIMQEAKAMIEQQATEIERLRTENQQIRAAFRVNILRLAPGTSHAEIDELLTALTKP